VAVEAIAMQTSLKKKRLDLRELIGSGDRIGRLALPFVLGGVTLNILFPSLFEVGGPPPILRTVSIVVATMGIVVWIWSVALILRHVPRGELITGGPYRVVKHPLYTGVSLLVLPWIGFLLNTWLGAALGIVLYLASRVYAPEEEAHLKATFGPRWEAYRRAVWIPWL
jgi:protein-S-isoprenylcysteine O-methyltransferase Ste14